LSAFCAVRAPDLNETVARGIWQRPKEQRVANAEHRGRSADANRDAGYGNDRWKPLTA
jgi:hypothetical protein